MLRALVSEAIPTKTCIADGPRRQVTTLVDPLLGLLGDSADKQSAPNVKQTNPNLIKHRGPTGPGTDTTRRVQVEVKVKALKLLGRLVRPLITLYVLSGTDIARGLYQVECCWFSRSAVFMKAWVRSAMGLRARLVRCLVLTVRMVLPGGCTSRYFPGTVA